MSKEQKNEFMFTPVPMDQRRPTFNQVMVWVGFGYVVTGLFIGGLLAGAGGGVGLPPLLATLSVVIGMGLLFIMTSFLGIIAQKTGLSLALVSRYSYGSKGIIIPMLVMAMLTLGWFASILGMIGDIWGSFIGNKSNIIMFNPANFGFENISPITLEVFLACLLSGLLFTVSATIGIKALEAIAIPLSPVILVIAIIVGVGILNEGGGGAVFAKKASSLPGTWTDLGHGITLVVGSWIAGCIMGVDLFRFNKNIRAVFWGAAACFFFTNPLLNLVGYISEIQIGQYNYISWMLGLSPMLAVIGVFVWTASLWTTDNAELYCNALYVGPILDVFKIKINRKVLVFSAGIIGTILGSLAFYHIFFADFITILGVAAPPLAGPILADYFFINKAKYNVSTLNSQPSIRYAGVISFLIGVVLGLLFHFKISLPLGLPPGVVALIITMIIYIGIYKFTPDSKWDNK